MNSSSSSTNTVSTVRGCDPAIPQGTLDHTTPEAYITAGLSSLPSSALLPVHLQLF